MLLPTHPPDGEGGGEGTGGGEKVIITMNMHAITIVDLIGYLFCEYSGIEIDVENKFPDKPTRLHCLANYIILLRIWQHSIYQRSR